MAVTLSIAAAAAVAFLFGYVITTRIAARKYRAALADMESLGETLKQPIMYAELQLRDAQQELQELQRQLEVAKLLSQENEQLTGSVIALRNELTAVQQDRFEEVAKRLAREKKFAEQFQNYQQWLAQARKDNRQLMSGFQEIAGVLQVMSLSGVLPADVVWRGHEPVSESMIAKCDEKFKQALEAVKTQTPKEDDAN